MVKTLDVFKSFSIIVENQLNKGIKIVRFDRYDKYRGQYDD